MRVSSAFLVLASLTFALSEATVLNPVTWALLVAGSTGWSNYRHQADICHAYQALLTRGVRKDRIITFMYGDIAFNHRNPHKGVIINRPGGPNVYEGVNIDYKGKNVTVDNFLNVLLGKEAEMENIGTGRVLKSGHNDTVFVNFADHGASGILGFPNQYLYADDLISTLHKMNKQNRYGKVVLFIEACEAGSMFDNLIEHFDNIFVTTASATDESSWAWYCTDRNLVTCLGDLYSISWMERLDKLNTSETLFDNYDGVRTRVRRSHVNLYGDYRLGFLEEFVSAKPGFNRSLIKTSLDDEKQTGVDSRDVPLFIARMEELYANGSAANDKREHLRKLIEARLFADELISKVLQVFADGNSDMKIDLEVGRYSLNPSIFDCYKRIVTSFDEHCFKIYKNTYFMKHLYKFTNICVMDTGTEKAVSAIESVCQELIEKIKNVDIDIE